MSIRRRIDALDAQIVAALDERARLALAAGEKKRARGETIYDPGREAEVLARVAEKRRGPFPERVLAAIFREIIGASRALESPLRAAYLGPPATFTHTAAVSRLGRAAEYLPAESIPDCFAEVEKGRADVAVVPVENAIEGAVVHTLDRLVDSPLAILGEIVMPVDLCLMTRRRGVKRIRRILSHPQALAQCRRYLEERHPGVPLEGVSSTAAAAARAAKSPGVAAIASPLAAETYNLVVRAASIQDLEGNATRFLILGSPRAEKRRRGVAYKTSIAFSLKDRPGALYDMLTPFKEEGVNLTKIESRPARVEVWRYTFFLDMEGHRDDPPVARALERLARDAPFFRVLGAYPRDEGQTKGEVNG